MKKMFLMFFVVFFSFSLMACTSTNIVRLNPTIHPPTSYDLITVYEYESQVGAEFEKLAVITVKGSSLWKTKEGLLKKLKEKAAAMGANAVILSTTKKTSAGMVALDVWFTGGLLSKKQYSAIAIYVHPKQ